MKAFDARQLIDSDSPDILHEFGEILGRKLADAAKEAEAYCRKTISDAYNQAVKQLLAEGKTEEMADAHARMRLGRWAQEVARTRDVAIQAAQHQYQDAIFNLLRWWKVSSWNPDNEAVYPADVEEPRPLSEAIDAVFSRVLPETVARRRVELLREHADAVIALRDTARRVWEEMLAREVRTMVMDGMGPRTAEAAARANLAIRKQELDAEVEENLDRLSARLQRKMERLMEDAEDEGFIPPPVQD